MKNTKKWVACWGYDQTQYSIYEEVSRKGCFVVVRGYNDWACLEKSDLYNGSKVKLYKTDLPDFYEISESERAAIANKFRWSEVAATDYNEWNAFRRFEYKNRREKAKVRTIAKVAHETNERGYRYWVWILDNGQVVKATDEIWGVDIIDALTRRKIRTTNYFGEPEESIKINSCIRAYLDKRFNENAERYEEQNEYTFYNGR